MSDNVITTESYVKLNVGGHLFHTTIDTLTKQDSMLRAMFSGQLEVVKDKEGFVLIDRSGEYFGYVINYLRDGSLVLPENREAVQAIMNEAKFYCLSGLVNDCDTFLKSDNYMDGICQIPLVASPQQFDHIMRECHKPTVKLVCNRHNNKYSYTPSSDDGFLKNVELFEKLALHFHHRIQFVKDTLGASSEICCWVFYGDQLKQSEICCTSIVYGQDKKHTKIDFPEASIYKEILYLFLFEVTGNRRSNLDAESLRQFWSAAAGNNNPPSINRNMSDEDAEELVQHAIHVRLRNQQSTSKR